jgi:exopolysaccharide biosynthesis protein
VALDRPEPLHRWARRSGAAEAISGGFYVPGGTPLGELHTDGNVQMTVPFDAPWDARRSCLSVIGDFVEIAPRGALPSHARGDLLQAGPLLVANGKPLVATDERDPQGFGAGSGQFDCDVTGGRYPRAAFGIARDRFLAVVCDGRSIRDAGMTLGELARVMADLGAESALNLCGGASASLVSGGALHNRPRDYNGVSLLGGRPVTSAIVFDR